MSFFRSSSNLQAYYKAIPQTTKRLNIEMAGTPMMNAIFRNKQGLIYSATVIDFTDEKWNRNPQQFAFDQYNNQFFYPVILIVNNLGSIYEFHRDNLPKGIITPDESVMYNIINHVSPVEAAYER